MLLSISSGSVIWDEMMLPPHVQLIPLLNRRTAIYPLLCKLAIVVVVANRMWTTASTCRAKLARFWSLKQVCYSLHWRFLTCLTIGSIWFSSCPASNKLRRPSIVKISAGKQERERERGAGGRGGLGWGWLGCRQWKRNKQKENGFVCFLGLQCLL